MIRMKKIKLTQGKYALIDDEDFDRVSKFKWWTQRCINSSYAVRVEFLNRKRRIVYMHRFILNHTSDLEIDHKNGNGLDNRKNNLRPVTHQQNSMNRAIGKNNSSGYKGVSFKIKTGKYYACIIINGKFVHLGVFLNALDASKAYEKKAKEVFGEFRRL